MTTSSSKPDADQLTFWSEAPPAKVSPSLALEKEWTTTVVTSPSSFAELLTRSSPVGSFGKMCVERCQVTEDETLVPSSGRWLKSGVLSPTESWTLNTSTAPQGGSASLLSDIKEPIGDHLLPYYLTPRQAQTYQRRAITAPLKLPERLKAALSQVGQTKTHCTSSLTVSDERHPKSGNA